MILSAFQRVGKITFLWDVLWYLVTLCMNGLHSKRKLHEHYPEFGQNILRHIYKGIPPSFLKNQTAVQLMKNVDFDDFTNKTSIDFKVLGCRYMNKYCVRYWKTVKIWIFILQHGSADKFIVWLEKGWKSTSRHALVIVASFRPSCSLRTHFRMARNWVYH